MCSTRIKQHNYRSSSNSTRTLYQIIDFLCLLPRDSKHSALSRRSLSSCSIQHWFSLRCSAVSCQMSWLLAIPTHILCLLVTAISIMPCLLAFEANHILPRGRSPSPSRILSLAPGTLVRFLLMKLTLVILAWQFLTGPDGSSTLLSAVPTILHGLDLSGFLHYLTEVSNS